MGLPEQKDIGFFYFAFHYNKRFKGEKGDPNIPADQIRGFGPELFQVILINIGANKEQIDRFAVVTLCKLTT